MVSACVALQGGAHWHAWPVLAGQIAGASEHLVIARCARLHADRHWQHETAASVQATGYRQGQLGMGTGAAAGIACRLAAWLCSSGKRAMLMLGMHASAVIQYVIAFDEARLQT